MLIDAHVHLDKYGDRLDDALKEIANEKIFTVATAMDVPSYLELQEIGKRSNLILPTFGIHPRRAAEYADRLPEISRYIESSPAIGEIGLDFHWVKDTSTYPAQRKVLEYFIAAAAEQNKFVNLHTKAGEKEILDLLEKYGMKRAIIHWYSGPMDILRAMIDFGCYFTIGVEVLYSDYIKSIAKAVRYPSTSLCQACITSKYPTPSGQRLYQIARENVGKGSCDSRTYEVQQSLTFVQ